MPNLEELWAYLNDKFREELTPVGYSTWIQTAKPVKLTKDKLEIEVPASLHKAYWEKNLVTKVVEGVYEFAQLEVDPVIMTKDELQPAPATDQRPAVEEDDQNLTFKAKTHLNPKYTFDHFVIGKGNQMAHAAALAVAEAPGTTYNPLFIYGGVGLGKTHLMQAIGNLVLGNNPAANIKYVTSENFANDFINSIQTKQQEQFRQEYRNVDLLLVDDIQFFGDKEATQEEFFHTFNTLYENMKQIVLTSDRLPNEIPKLQERLVSRFNKGLSVDVTPPDLETRIAILRNKADAEDLSIPDDTLSYIAGQIESNVRDLEGALVRVQAFSTMKNEDITTSLAADALKALKLDDRSGQLTIPQILNAVAKYFQLTVQDLKGKKRVKQIVIPRQIAMYLAREMTDNSLPKIGQEIGGKDHTTVIHAHEKIMASMTTDENLKAQVIELRNILKNRG
ncbi:chromosomal replication initiator protein DnaA [Lacticaseibacillus paracasei]|jgi:chromosomal replication initiator protein|uniref:Chromosomal replication initiator protein DnaA n=2 Tax=Lacticaseibacillus paracasei TaxID=1597 RepID=DNAA_LACP3|nr:chromosomal replication initiator protein DnaA [Lacticaseibacillus paracasei]Q03D55.1 RecName: Full=Chromosomal replication initiator protein DnaA [Lacticaseibacillus paracasei ATCC 334]EPC68732.1 chromosomal replication initiation protein [Lacticaseibacillus paracasei subsp. paracasei Lpp14]KRK16394.1 chromosomal replication initiation protein [Lacticaseibacillus casei DSM 20011 = JCM 1134 = ATCC 393]ABJ68867.1 DNA replication ATPase initiation [Lacticaseibacillus paracasei ATCC 334]OSY804